MRLYLLVSFAVFIVSTCVPSHGQNPIPPQLQAQPGKLYEVQLGVQVSGMLPFHFDLKSGNLPTELHLLPNGLLRGTPNRDRSGDYTFTVTVTDFTGKQIEASFLLRIAKTIPVGYAQGVVSASTVSTASNPATGASLSQQGHSSSSSSSTASGSSPSPSLTQSAVTPASSSAKQPPKPSPARIDGTLKEGNTKVTITIDPQPNDVEVFVCVFPGATTPGKSDCTQSGTVGVQPIQTIKTATAPSHPSEKIAKDTKAKSVDFTPIQPLACGEVVMLVMVDSTTKERQYSVPAAVCGVPAPTQDNVLGVGVSFLEGHAGASILTKGHVDQYDHEVRISIRSCIVNPKNSIDKGSPPCPGTLIAQSLTNGPSNQDHYVDTDKDGFYSAGLQVPITCKNKPKTKFFSVEAHDMSSDVKAYSPWVDACPQIEDRLTVNRCDREYNDCDEGFSVIGGVEQAGLSAQPNQTNAFLRAFTRSGPLKGSISAWGTIRLLGAPEASSTANVISAVADPSGVLVTKNFATVGSAIDYIAGVEWAPDIFHNYSHGGQFSTSFIAGFGATTPLSAQNLVLAYTVPPLNTVECGQLQTRFTLKNGYNPFPVPGMVGTLPGTTTPNTSCLFNTAGTAANPPANSGTPIQTLAFTNQDRFNFLVKYGAGVRLITRFHTGSSLVCGDAKSYDPERGPCERGVIDFIVGQDEAITGGYLRRFVFKIDGVHPLPIAGSKILYLFGNVSLRFTRNHDLPPLILQSAALDPLTKNGPTSSVFVLPLKQPDRDFYRYGVGLNLTEIFAKLSSKATDDKTKPVTIAPPKSQTSPSDTTPQ